jgi:hypothetical protein
MEQSMSDGKRVYLYFPESDMPAYEALQKLCPESVPLATFLRSVLVRYASGKLQYTSEHSEHSESTSVAKQRYGNSESASVAQQSATAPEHQRYEVEHQRYGVALRSSNQKEHSFLSGIDGMLVDDSEDQEG